jgi:hypothetical protein
MQRLSPKKILAAIGCPYLSLHKGKGYWYFVYDSADDQAVYNSMSIYTYRLSHMSLEGWVTAGKAFVTAMQKIHIVEEF